MVSKQRYAITDEGALHKYRTEIPNSVVRGVKGRGLSLPARWLYVYLKSVAGDSGECWQNTTTMAEGAQLGRGTVTGAKAELVQRALIAVSTKREGYHASDKIRILDIWEANMREFASFSCSPHEQLTYAEISTESSPSTPGCSGDEQPINHRSPDEQPTNTQPPKESMPISSYRSCDEQQEAGCSGDERSCSSGERSCSSHERKKISLKKISQKKEERDPPLPPAPDDAAPVHTPAPALPPPSRAPRPSRTKASQTPATNYTPGFQRAWTAYPAARREGKVAVFAIWTQRGLEPRAAEIAEKLERLTLTLWAGREKQYIPMPATWFNQARYEDELPLLGDVTAPAMHSRLSDKELRSAQAIHRFMERHNGPEAERTVSRSHDETRDHVQYRTD